MRAAKFHLPGKILAGALLLAAGIALYTQLSALCPKTADQVNYLQAGLAVLDGNVRLHGWRLTPPDFYTWDIVLTALLAGASHLFAPRAGTAWILAVQPAITWVLILTASLRLAIRPGSARLAPALVIAATLGLPLVFRDRAIFLILLSAMHLGSLLYTLLAFHLAASPASHRTRNLALLVLVTASGVFGDPLVLFICIAPLLIAPVFRRETWPAALAACLGAALGKSLLSLNIATGGFSQPALPMVLAAAENLPAHAALAAHILVELFSAGFFNRTPLQAIPELLHLPLLLLALFAGATTLKNSRMTDTLSLLLAWAAALNIAALIASTMVEQNFGSFMVARYLLPAWVFLAILLARAPLPPRRLAALSTAALLSAAIVLFPRFTQKPTGFLTADQQSLLAWLENNAPPDGIGSYFVAAPLQFASGNRLRITQATAWPADTITPLTQISPPASFPDPARDFFVIVSTDQPNYTLAQALGTFGKPTRTGQVAGSTVLIYAR